ncbi:uncharacterized protein Dana_GF11593 [Drosophila ananassae]|uniref:Uncharacterized protein n=1 Tax=Drosophila ananassae TaxID=7217 RepID=A0A0P8YCA4_DROAN|nr:uncharacterized protein Dana_GF11593 [Drosophila ananassae]
MCRSCDCTPERCTMAYSYICICVGFFFVLMAAVDVLTGGFPIQYLFVPILGLSYMLAGILMQVGMNKKNKSTFVIGKVLSYFLPIAFILLIVFLVIHLIFIFHLCKYKKEVF